MIHQQTEQVSHLVDDLKISEGKRVEGDRKIARLVEKIEDLENVVENLKLNYHQIEQQNEVCQGWKSK